MTTDLIAMAQKCGLVQSTPVDGNFYLYCSPEKFSAFRVAILADAAQGVKPFVFEEYPYNPEAMGCGLEDRCITDRYEAMAYGWERAMERAAEAIPDDLVPAATVAGLQARIAELEAQLLAALAETPKREAGPVNPYLHCGSMEEAWRKGFFGEPMLAAKGSDYARAYIQGREARSNP